MAKRRRQHGEGSLHKRPDGRWQAVVELDRVAGKRQRRYFYGATQDEARDKAAKFRADRKAGFERPTGKGPTVAEWLETWLADICTAPAPQSRRRYDLTIRAYLVPALGRIWLADLDEAPIRAMQADMKRRGLSESTRSQAHRVLRQALQAAVAERKIPRNPCQNVKLSPVREIEPPIPSAAEITALLAALERGAAAIPARWYLAVGAGLRQAEALGLLWDCVDLDAAVLEVRWQLRPVPGGGGRAELAQPKTARGRRRVLLDPPAVAMLREHRRRQAAAQLAAGPAWAPWRHGCSRRPRPAEVVCPGCGKPCGAGLVFTTPTGGPVGARDDYRDWAALREAAGIGAWRIHDLRHCYTTLLEETGAPMGTIQDLVGHADYKVTRRYIHPSDAAKRAAVDAMSAQLWSGR